MDKSQIIRDYFKYYFHAKTKHSIHSPFVFEFVTKVLEQKYSKDPILEKIENLRKELKSSKKEIHVYDFGASAGNSQTRIRRVSEIVKNSAKRKKYARLLYRIINHYKLINILELGTSAGLSSMYMAATSPENTITTIEGCPETARLAEDNFNRLNYQNILQVIGNFDIVLPETVEHKKFDLVFFDGNHREDATLRYFEQCLPTINNESVFIFDDINWSEGMKNAWDKIKKHPSVKVSIDLFFLGIVFFRKELSKEDFVIRF